MDFTLDEEYFSTEVIP
jgi:hypothetical protein